MKILKNKKMFFDFCFVLLFIFVVAGESCETNGKFEFFSMNVRKFWLFGENKMIFF